MTDMDVLKVVEVISAACHSAWYAYTVLGLGEAGEPWDSAPDWQRESLHDAVRFWDEQVAIRRSAARDPDVVAWARIMLPRLSHQNWLNHKTCRGWVYGPVKDPEKKTHPCMVAYTDLPPAQQRKDRVVVEAYIAVRLVAGLGVR